MCASENRASTDSTFRYFDESNFWQFQAVETGLMFALSSAVSGIGMWRVRRLG